MNFFSPDRPRLANGLPRHLEHNFALPSFQVHIIEDPGEGKELWIEIGVMLPGSRHGYHWAAKSISAWDLPGFLAGYHDDPEGVLANVFGMDLKEVRATGPEPEAFGKEIMDLSDLGDLFT